MTTTQDAVLIETLRIAVPLYLLEIRHMIPEQRAALGRKTADVIAHKGDVLMFGGSRKGETAGAFNALAQGLAAAAYLPGGVTFAGLHWCLDHGQCKDAADECVELHPKQFRPRRPIVDLELPS